MSAKETVNQQVREWIGKVKESTILDKNKSKEFQREINDVRREIQTTDNYTYQQFFDMILNRFNADQLNMIGLKKPEKIQSKQNGNSNQSKSLNEETKQSTNNWTCSQCTLINEFANDKCSACEREQPEAIKQLKLQKQNYKKEVTDIADEVDNIQLKEEFKKKNASYTYWFDSEEQKKQNFVKKVPQKINPVEVKENTSNNNVQSNWNHNGTWEQINVDLSFVQKAIQNKFINFNTDDGLVQINDVSNLNGDCSVVYTRGKIKLGYQLDFKLKFQGNEQFNDVEGYILYSTFEDDGDIQFSFDFFNNRNKNQILESLKNNIQRINENIVEGLESLKKNMAK